MRSNPTTFSAGKLALLLAATTLSGCAFFTTVTVPTSDNTHPQVLLIDYDHASKYYHTICTNNDPWVCVEATVDAAKTWNIAAIAIDDGGVSELTFSGSERVYCSAGFTAATTSSFSNHKTQQGGPGSTVFNGLWAGEYLGSGAGIGSAVCGNSWRRVEWTLMVEGVDFHNNSTMRLAVIKAGNPAFCTAGPDPYGTPVLNCN